MYDRTSWLPQVGAVSQALSQIATLAMPTKTPFDSSARPMLDAMKGPGTQHSGGDSRRCPGGKYRVGKLVWDRFHRNVAVAFMQLRAAGSRAPRNQPIKPRSSWAILSSKFRLTGGTTRLLNVPPPSLSPISNTKGVLRRRRGEHLTSGSGTTMWLATNKQQALNSSQRALSGRLYIQVRIQAAQNTTIRLLPTVGDLRCQRPKAAQACPDRLPQHRAPLMGEKRQCVVVPQRASARCNASTP